MQELLNELEHRLRTILREEFANALNEHDTIAIGRSSEGDHLLTASEVAHLLQLSIQKIYRLSRRSSLSGFPVLRIGERTMRYDREEILTWVKEQNN